MSTTSKEVMDAVNKLSPEQQKELAKIAEKAGIKSILSDAGVLKQPCDEWLDKFVTEDVECKELKARVRKVWNREEPVCILGETGTGKEIIAHALHGNRKGNFKSINITALPNELIESELFGHVKGAFTGAIETKVGLFESAFNGTLFLDEIGDMPLTAQAKLLRAIQEKRIRRVGDVNEMEIKCRIVCATHRNLEQMVNDGLFREDLYWRLNIIVLKIKPLRERGLQDIYELHDAIFKERGIVPATVLERIGKLELKGNVREFEARCLRYILFGEE
jgi:transcriptional regulator with PAS, ATPase and Fis domain